LKIDYLCKTQIAKTLRKLSTTMRKNAFEQLASGFFLLDKLEMYMMNSGRPPKSDEQVMMMWM